jgi:soluble lytic murein transglycosylase
MIQQMALIGMCINLSFCTAAIASLPELEAILAQSKLLESKTKLESRNVAIRWNHAKELLGKKYRKSAAKTGENINSIDEVLMRWTKQALWGKWKSSSEVVAQTIIEESNRYGFDPVFLMAVIENESSFNPDARGPCGEIGLMQLTIETAEWITKKLNLPWRGKKSLQNPRENIRIGAAYLNYLRARFDSVSDLYIAAYNMGTGNVEKALTRRDRPKRYHSRVMRRYLKFYAKLQKEIEVS